MTKLLAIDSTTQACSAALLIDNSVKEEFKIAPRQHTQLLLPMIESLLAEASLTLNNLDAIAIAHGPGSFTGIRIAVSIAQGLAFAADLPIVPISSLAALAQSAFRQYQTSTVIPAFDARMQEIYWGTYILNANQCMQGLIEDNISAPDKIQIPTDNEWTGIGDAWQLESMQPIAAQLNNVYPNTYPHAQDVASLAQEQFKAGHIVSAKDALPVYLRNTVVTATRKKHG